VATVRNLGTAPLPPGAAVGFYMGTAPNGTLLGTGATTKALNPAEGDKWSCHCPTRRSRSRAGTTTSAVNLG